MKNSLPVIIASMVFQLVNELCCIKHCEGVCGQNSIVNGVRIDDWSAECVIIASNVT